MTRPPYDIYTVPDPLPLPAWRVWWRRHHDMVLAVLIVLVFVLYLGFEIARAHVAGRM